jgi:glycosyltransferase involved in cell wall biosynthesis
MSDAAADQPKARSLWTMRTRLTDPSTPGSSLADRPLRICLLSYRSNPHSGGQGVYVGNLGRALQSLGHEVEIVTGPPPAFSADGIALHRIAGLDLYNPDDLFRVPTLKELADPLNLMEWIGVSTMGFPEPFLFGVRAYRFLNQQLHRYDIIHDNQSLSYGVWALKRRLPTVATIHHAITVDRRIDILNADGCRHKMKFWRWYSFIGMQKRVSRTLSHIITVSQIARDDISRNFSIPVRRLRIVPNGIDTAVFRPMPEIEREAGRIIVTNSADTPLKGLHHLLRAVADISAGRPLKLIVVGRPKPRGRIVKLIGELGLGQTVTFTGGISTEEFVRQYARAAVAVVPSIYEGFGLPAGEAMACAVPLISTTGGALPEVVGRAGLLVPPGSSAALSAAIKKLLDEPQTARNLGWAGYKRVQRLFTWDRAARLTADVYREAIRDYR